MILIVGLGNIGQKFQNTRHNLGFMVIDELAKLLDFPNFKHEQKFQAEICQKDNVILAKPETMMNKSGGAVSKIAAYYKIEASNIWVVHDELDLPFGTIRVRIGGGAAGHNGIKSIVAKIGDSFWRFRIGIGRSVQFPAEDYVLAAFNTDEQSQLPGIIKQATENISFAFDNGPVVSTQK